MVKILFVCLGNICRSPMAEFIMKNKVSVLPNAQDFYIESAATSNEESGHDMHYGSRTCLNKQGIPYERHCARRITKSDYDNFDYIIGMEDCHVNSMLRVFGDDPKHKVYRLLDFTSNPHNIADPYYSGDFELTFKEINEGLDGLILKLQGLIVGL